MTAAAKGSWLDRYLVAPIVNGDAPTGKQLNLTGSAITVSHDDETDTTTVSVDTGVEASLTAAATIEQGQAVHTTSSGKATPATTGLRSIPLTGIAKDDAAADETTKIHSAGPLERTIKNLGAGVACAVGVTVAGVPVRATDATCASAPNWIGSCDTDGTITVNPHRDSVLDVLDFGADPTGVAFCDDAFDAAIAKATIGDTIFLPAGTYRTKRTFGPFPRGVSVAGVGGSHYVDYLGSVIAYEGLGDAVRHSRDINSNNSIDGKISGLLIRCANGGGVGLYNQAPQRQSPSKVVGAIEGLTNAGGLMKVKITAHGLKTGNLVAIDSVVGSATANSGWQITRVDDDYFTLDGSTFDGYTSGGNVRTRCGAGLVGIGTGNFTWEDVHVSGFGVGFMLDGAENGTIRRCSSDGYAGQSDIGTNSKRFSCGIWFTDGDTGCSGWTVSGSTNVHTIEDFNFQGCRIGAQIDGCAAVTIRSLRTGNLAGAGLLNKSVTGAADNGSGKIRLTVVGHGLLTGDYAGVSAVGGVPNATGEWQVTKIDNDHIDLIGSTFAGSFTTGGKVAGYCPATVARINGATGLFIEATYSEGAGDAHFLFERQTESSTVLKSSNVVMKSVLAVGGCPAIALKSTCESLALVGNNWTASQCIGCNFLTGYLVQLGDFFSSGFASPGDDFFDTETGCTGGLRSFLNNNKSNSFNGTAGNPNAHWDIFLNDFAESAIRVRQYGVRWLDFFARSNGGSDLQRNVQSAGGGQFGGASDGVRAGHLTQNHASAAIATSETIPPKTGGVVGVCIVGAQDDDPTKTIYWLFRLQITCGAAGSAAIADVTSLGSKDNAGGAFGADPTFSIVGDQIVVSVQGNTAANATYTTSFDMVKAQVSPS